MSDLTASVTKDKQGSIVVEGNEALKYNFHYTSPVFDVDHSRLADISLSSTRVSARFNEWPRGQC
jgi:3-dehydroquinate synthase